MCDGWYVFWFGILIRAVISNVIVHSDFQGLRQVYTDISAQEIHGFMMPI